MGFENKPPVDPKDAELFEKINIEEQGKLDKNVEDLIGQERLNHLVESINQLSIGVKNLILAKEENERGSGAKIEELLRGASNNIYGHATGTNGNPEKLIRALEEFRDKTNFA
jgi:hypothetical protein